MKTVAPTRRVAAFIALAAGTTLALVGCGSGQISQMTTQVAAVNGSAGELGPISLRNLHVLYPSADYSNAEGGKAALAFFVVNTSEDKADKLEKITSDAGSVTIKPEAAPELDPQAAIEAVPPTALASESASESTAPSTASEQATVRKTKLVVEINDLKRSVSPGLTVAVTFTFAEAGDITINVPVDAAAAERIETEKSGLTEEHGSAGGQEAEGGH